MALTRDKERVSVTHCSFRRGYVQPSRFIDDIPELHRVTGWLRAQVKPGFVRQGGSRVADDLNAMELL